MLIKLDDVSYVYSKGTPFEKVAVNDVNVEIEKGAFVGVIGHTGSGKSTLVQHLNALLQPTSGKVYIDGRGYARRSQQAAEIPLQGGSGVPVPGIPALRGDDL